MFRTSSYWMQKRSLKFKHIYWSKLFSISNACFLLRVAFSGLCKKQWSLVFKRSTCTHACIYTSICCDALTATSLLARRGTGESVAISSTPSVGEWLTPFSVNVIIESWNWRSARTCLRGQAADCVFMYLIVCATTCIWMTDRTC